MMMMMTLVMIIMMGRKQSEMERFMNFGMVMTIRNPSCRKDHPMYSIFMVVVLHLQDFKYCQATAVQ